MTISLPAAEKLIRFQLGEMSSRNEHHEFEEMAIRIARRRISGNILIATGPVSAGGDQQRDGESYFTRIPDELPHSAGFAAAASTKPVVIACTTQKGGLKQKVLDDLEGICSADASQVEKVAFFSIHPIPAAQTHSLQKTALDQYSVGLDVFSGDDLSTMLAEPDLIWVAVHYLDLPSDMVPEPESEPSPEWYRELLDSLRSSEGPTGLTPGVQGAVTRGIRFATWDPYANADLPEWFDFMGAFLADSEDGADSEVVFRACYEMAVARLRGIGNAYVVEDLIRRALGYALTVDTPTVLADAATLASYWGSAWSAGVAAADASEISAAVEGLRSHADAALDATDPATHPVRAASLTSTMARLCLIPKWADVADELGIPQPVETDAVAGKALDHFEFDTSVLASSALIDLSQAMRYLRQLAEVLPNARPFPVDSVATIFQLLAPALIKDPDYRVVRDALDDATAAVEGEGAKAERCRDRAIALLQAGDHLEALAELHEAKLGWFHGDTMYGAVLVMRYIAKVYADLGLIYAAKMYACSAAAMAIASEDHELRGQTADALLEAMLFAQQAGCWIDAAGLGRVAVLARHSLLANPFDYEKHPEFENAELNAGLELTAIRKYWPALEEPFVKGFGTTGWDRPISEAADEGADALTLSEGEFQRLAGEQFSGPILGDIGPRRVVDFRALGVRWSITFPNDRATVLAGEALCAALQVTLAEIAGLGPVFSTALVRVEVRVLDGASGGGDACDIDDAGPEIVARVAISNGNDDAAHQRSRIATITMLLDAINVRPSDELHALLEPMFTGGLPHKVSIGRPYEDAAGLLDKQHYEMCAAASRPASSSEFDPVEAEALAAATSPGTGYDRGTSLQLIRERYESTSKTLPRTLARFLADERGRELVTQLRADGWLDWQILVSVFNVVANWRVKESGLDVANTDPRQIHKVAMTPEVDSSPEFPLELCIGDELAVGLNIQVISVARRWNIRSVTRMAAPDALKDVLVRRYGYSEDDVPHVDLLESLDADGNLVPLIDVSGDGQADM